MTHKAEITNISALTKRLCSDKIDIRQVAVIDDIRMAAHGTKLHVTHEPRESLRRCIRYIQSETLPSVRLYTRCNASQHRSLFFEAKGINSIFQEYGLRSAALKAAVFFISSISPLSINRSISFTYISSYRFNPDTIIGARSITVVSSLSPYSLINKLVSLLLH